MVFYKTSTCGSPQDIYFQQQFTIFDIFVGKQFLSGLKKGGL